MADIPMTDEECRIATDRLSEQLDRSVFTMLNETISDYA